MVIGFSRKLKAPCCIASTALGTVAWPVTRITSASGSVLAGAAEDLHAVDVVHHQVGDDDVERVGLDLAGPPPGRWWRRRTRSPPWPGSLPSPGPGPRRYRRSSRRIGGAAGSAALCLVRVSSMGAMITDELASDERPKDFNQYGTRSNLACQAANVASVRCGNAAGPQSCVVR